SSTPIRSRCSTIASAASRRAWRCCTTILCTSSRSSFGRRRPMAKLVIFGAGDIARLAHYYFERDSEHEVVGFVVDRDYRTAESLFDKPVVATDELVARFPPAAHAAFVALSYAAMNRRRAAKYAELKGLGYRLVSYVSSRCSFLSDQAVGDNCFILEDNTI